MRFLHCSDIHITQNYASPQLLKLGWRRWLAMFELTVGGRAYAYRDAARTLTQIVKDVHRHNADHLLISGDITAYATDAEFRSAREALGAIANDRTACSIIPGNHDVFTPNAAKTHRFETHFGHLLTSDMPEYQREDTFPFVHLKGDEAAVVGLMSARVMPMPGLSYGTIGPAQLTGLRELLDDPRMRHRATLVMVHHAPLDPLGRPDSRTHGLVDADALLRMLPGPRFAVLHGHLHERYQQAATTSRPHTFCAGSSTQRGREGYWLIEVTDGLVRGGTIHVPNLSPER